MDTRYKEQWARLKRWYLRLEENRAGSKAPPDRQLDDLYAFFLNCYHFKDWLIESRPQLKVKIEALYDSTKGNDPLKIAADIANSLKHVKATHNPRFNTPASVVGQNVRINLEGPVRFGQRNQLIPVSTQYSWAIQFGGKVLDAYIIAGFCIDRLKEFSRGQELELE